MSKFGRIPLMLTATFVGVFTIGVARAAELVSYRDHQLLHVHGVTRAQLANIEATGAVVLDCAVRPGHLDVVASPAQAKALRGLGLEMEVKHRDVQALIDAERRPNPRRGGDPYADFFLDYHEYDNGTGSIGWFMNELVMRYPNLITMINVGTSTEGRTIWGLRLANDAVGGNKSGGAVLLLGARP
jgi:hypothetical protein